MTQIAKKRKIKLIQPRLQLRLIAAFLGIAAISLLSQFLLLGRNLSELALQLPGGGEHLAAALPDLLIEVLIFSFAILLPLSFAVGISMTFRIAGPVYRFEQHLTRVARGETVEPCRIRTGDELQGLCRLINEALATASRGAQRNEADGDSDTDVAA